MKPKHYTDLNKEELARRKREEDYREDQLDEFSKRAVRGLQYAESEASLRNAFQTIEQHIDQKAPRPGRLRHLTSSRLFGAIAAVLVIGLLGLTFLWGDLFNRNQRLADQYFSPPENAMTRYGNRGDETVMASLRQAMQAYDTGAYRNALPHFQSHLQKHPEDSEARFYYGSALFEMGRQAEALAAFQKIEARNNLPGYSTSLDWHLALAHLSQRNLTECRRILQMLSREEGRTGRRARKLLGELKD